MITTSIRRIVPAGAMATLAAMASVAFSPAQSLDLQQLRQQTRIHGIAVDRGDPARVLLATHHGFFAVTGTGQAIRLSEARNHYMGFTPHPGVEGTLYTRGHPTGGGNPGFIVSRDRGRTRHQRSPWVDGPVTTARLYVATVRGLLISDDGGRNWQRAHPASDPATLVETTPQGEVYVFLAGTGLVRATERDLHWEVISEEWGERILVHLADDPTNPSSLFAVARHGEILASTDGGRSWSPFARR